MVNKLLSKMFIYPRRDRKVKTLLYDLKRYGSYVYIYTIHNDEKLCKICEEHKKNIRLECGHCMCCEKCILKLSVYECPICREPFYGYFKNIKQGESFINPVNKIN